MENQKPIAADPPDTYLELTDILKKIKKERGRSLFVLISDSINSSIVNEIYDRRNELRVAAKEGGGLDILIHSPGGNLSQCYVIARLIARCTDSWEALVPEWAASGATLICMGSSNIVMSEMAQLSPLDPQVISKRREKFYMRERQSPLEAFEAVRHMKTVTLTVLDETMDFLQEGGVAPQLALETATKMAISFISPILGKIEPYDLGAFNLDSRVAVEYCKRVSNPVDKTKKTQRHVDAYTLVEKYPAHEFVIDLEEALALKFIVSEPSPAVDVLFCELRPHLKIKKFVGLVP